MRSIPALLLTLLLSPFASAQSFDCKLAKSPREHAICANADVSVLDSAVSAAYKSLRAQLSPQSAALVQSDQREWLHWLDLVCPVHGKGIADNINRCLKDAYTNRLRDLKQIRHIGTTVFFPRAHFVYKAGDKSYELVADNDPGFGDGSVRWPQIDIKPDRPNPAQTAWNAAVKAKAFKLAVVATTDGEDKNRTFDDSVDAGGSTDARFNLAAANGHLIVVDFLDGVYGYGAAHPNTGYTSFLWWLDRGRELTASDVFLPNSGWQHSLIEPVVRSLKANDRNQWFQDREADLPSAVAPAIQRTDSWSLSSHGLTITFDQYEFAPFAAGMPEACIPWSELKPFLAPDLDPATLPPPIHDQIP